MLATKAFNIKQNWGCKRKFHSAKMYLQHNNVQKSSNAGNYLKIVVLPFKSICSQ